MFRRFVVVSILEFTFNFSRGFYVFIVRGIISSWGRGWGVVIDCFLLEM